MREAQAESFASSVPFRAEGLEEVRVLGFRALGLGYLLGVSLGFRGLGFL